MITLLLVYSQLHKLWQRLLGEHLQNKLEKQKNKTNQQKQVLRIIFNKCKFEHTSKLFKYSKILNVYKLNIFNIAVFMHKIQKKSAPNIFLLKFRKSSHSYPVRIQHDPYI